MFNELKKLVFIFSLLILSIFSCGSYLLYKSYLSSYKSNFRAYVNANEKNVNSSVIHISPSDLYINSNRIIWEDENKEIIFDGILYDIVSMKNEGGKVILTVISDEQEEEIKKEFSENFKGNADSKTNNSFKLLKQFLALKYISNDDLFEINSNQIINEYQTDRALKLVSVFISTETLPPNQFI